MDSRFDCSRPRLEFKSECRDVWRPRLQSRELLPRVGIVSDELATGHSASKQRSTTSALPLMSFFTPFGGNMFSDCEYIQPFINKLVTLAPELLTTSVADWFGLKASVRGGASHSEHRHCVGTLAYSFVNHPAMQVTKVSFLRCL